MRLSCFTSNVNLLHDPRSGVGGTNFNYSFASRLADETRLRVLWHRVHGRSRVRPLTSAFSAKSILEPALRPDVFPDLTSPRSTVRFCTLLQKLCQRTRNRKPVLGLKYCMYKGGGDSLLLLWHCDSADRELSGAGKMGIFVRDGIFDDSLERKKLSLSGGKCRTAYVIRSRQIAGVASAPPQASRNAEGRAAGRWKIMANDTPGLEKPGSPPRPKRNCAQARRLQDRCNDMAQKAHDPGKLHVGNMCGRVDLFDLKFEDRIHGKEGRLGDGDGGIGW
nr:hypothetical protein CFP56_16837 [Quercus suber]